MPFTKAIDDMVISALFNGAPFTSYSDHYVALFTSDPTKTGTAGNEVSSTGTGYTRKPVDFTSSGSPTSNLASIEWGTATSSWGTLTHFGVYSAMTGGTLISYGPLATPKIIAQGDTCRAPISELTTALG